MRLANVNASHAHCTPTCSSGCGKTNVNAKTSDVKYCQKFLIEYYVNAIKTKICMSHYFFVCCYKKKRALRETFIHDFEVLRHIIITKISRNRSDQRSSLTVSILLLCFRINYYRAINHILIYVPADDD